MLFGRMHITLTGDGFFTHNAHTHAESKREKEKGWEVRTGKIDNLNFSILVRT